MREVYREKNTGIWTTRSRVLRAVVNAENKHRAAAVPSRIGIMIFHNTT
jgi:hypothetical protein